MRFWSGLAGVAVCAVFVSGAWAATVTRDSFGEGASAFEIQFVTISGATNPVSGKGIVNNDYRMGVFEITNDQWDKFRANLGVPVTGNPSSAYDSAYFTGTNMPITRLSWYEAAQFVNWLNTSTGYQPAYKFTGTQGTSDYTFATWISTDAGYSASNPYRNSNALYFLPTDDEWIKAAYWNGKALQLYATKDGELPTQGDGSSGSGWNFGYGYDCDPWDVGSGSEELNGTYDMMGNVWEWTESVYSDSSYASSWRFGRGGSFCSNPADLKWSCYLSSNPDLEMNILGFRVASAAVPEPASLAIWACGGLGALVLRRRRR